MLLKLQFQFGIAVLFALLVRHFMKKMPKIYSYVLWIVVFARLLLPFSFETEKALMPQASIVQEVDYNEMQGTTRLFLNERPVAERSMEYEAMPDGNIGLKTDHAAEKALFENGLLILWLIGTMAILAYNCAALIRVRQNIAEAAYVKDNIYVTDKIAAPFTIGFVKPKIYLPECLSEDEWDYIICHEQIHAKRKDNLVKNIAFLLTALYWWNPFTWTAFHFLEQDMEMSCDEAVLREMGGEIKRQYSQSLLNFAAGQKNKAFTPLTFGEVSVKQRVRNVLMKTKAGKWIGIIGVLLVVGAAVLIFTEKKPENEPQKKPSAENGQQEKEQSEEQLQEETKVFVQDWAEAFCRRDREYQIERMQEPLKGEAQKEYEAMENSFGWSSPWPFGEYPYTIDEIVWDSADSGRAVIRYYAMTSDPHVWVWREKLGIIRDEKGMFFVSSSKIKRYEEISSAEQFYEAYPNGKIDGEMNYRRSILGTVLNQNALIEESEYYSPLFSPETAAISLLNLSKESEVVKISGEEDDVTVEVYFPEQSKVDVRMVQSFGEDGIWIPQNSENSGDLEQFAQDWTTVFCEYDRLAQLEMMGEPLKSKAVDEYKKYPDWTKAKGWDRIWPYAELDDCVMTYPRKNIMEAAWETPETGKVVLWYFPIEVEYSLITVLRQELTVHLEENGKILVEDLAFKYFEEISSAEQFYEAYPSLDEMLRTEDAILETWNQKATAKTSEADDIGYEKMSGWLEPEKAAADILHLSADCKMEMDQQADDSGAFWMRILFPDESEVFVKMMQPFGEDGIRIPQDGRQ